MSPFRTCYLSALLALGFAHAGAAHAGEPVFSDGVSSMTMQAAATAILGLPPELRERAFASSKSLSQALGNLLVENRIEAAARAAGVADLAEVKAGIARDTQQVIVRKYLEDEIARTKAQVPDLTPRARELYEVSKASYAQREAIQAAHILFTVNPENEQVTEAEVRAKAEKVLLELRNGADFATMAKEYSEDPKSAGKGGMLNWQERGTLVPPFEKAAFALKPGEISGLVRTRFGFHIIKLINRRPATTPEFEEAKERIMAKLKDEYLAQRRREILARFVGTREVEIDDNAMQALRPK